MLDAFKIKPFDLQPIYASWTDGPRFDGNPKKDLPVDDWLDQIKAGCVERNIPEEYWYKVAQHFMGPNAKARLDELKQVISKVHGGKYRWTWKKFRIAMRNMGWSIDQTATETIKVQGKPSGLWFFRKKEEKEDKDDNKDTIEIDSTKSQPSQPLSRSSSSFWIGRKPSKDDQTNEVAQRPAPTRSESSFWPVRRNSKDEHDAPSQRPNHQKTKSDSVITTTRTASPERNAPVKKDTVEAGDSVTTVTHAPVWLLNACTALDYITSEHPKAMSVLSAILITAGSLPAIPAISAGAGGVVLASGAAQAIGAIAVGLGQALSTSMKNAQENQSSSASHVR